MPRYAHEHDPTLSKIAFVGDKWAGFYLLQEKSIYEEYQGRPGVLEDLTPYKDKRGVEGVALGVLPEFRGSGVGNVLKNVPRALGFDYIWGLQMKNLSNIADWLKRRRLIAEMGDMDDPESGGIYVTLEDL